jgi:agmatinase
MAKRPKIDNAFLGPLKGGALDPTYGGALSFMRRRYTRDLANADAVVWGIPFDSAVSNRPGARFGPAAIRRASAIFDGDPQYPFGFDPFADLAVVDYGDCAFDYSRPMDFAATAEAEAGAILDAGAHLFTLGGDHFCTYPLLRAHAARHGPLGLVQFDAHIDTWDEYFGGKYFHGTPFRRAIEEGLVDGSRFIQVGIRGPMYGEDDFDFHRQHGITMIDIDQVKARGITWTIDEIRRVATGPAYMTFDIDGVDPAFAPGTGTPEVGGLTSHDAQRLVRGLAAVRLVGGDVVEVAPIFDGPGQITALLAANLMFEFLCAVARQQR